MNLQVSTVENRLRFIEFCLFWEGRISRPRIQDQFKISSQQASNDLKRYKSLAPDNIQYSLEKRRYLKTKSFSPAFLKSGPAAYIQFLDFVSSEYMDEDETWISKFPKYDSVRISNREVKTIAFRRLIKAMRRNQSIEITYTSKSTSNKTVRRLTPLALGNDGNRWHVRAFDHQKEFFSDFTLSRISEVKNPEETSVSIKDDKSWNEYISVKLTPDTELKPPQKDALSFEYGMKNGVMTLKIRKAMLFYYLRRYGFNPKPLGKNIMKNESSFYLKIQNFQEVIEWLEYR